MKKALSTGWLGLFLAFLYLPIFVMILYSFNESKGRVWTGFSTKWYAELLQNEAILSSLVSTLLLAVSAALISTVLGTLAAIGLLRLHKRTRAVILRFTYLPMLNPEIITGVSLMLLFVTARQIFHTDFEFGFITLLLAHITFDTPYVILNVLPKLRQMDTSLTDAATDLGCNPVQAFFQVTIHEIMPGILAGFLMALTLSMDDFIISYFTSGPKFQPLSVLIYSMTKRKVSPQINALSTIMFLVILAVLVGSNLWELHKERRERSEGLVPAEV